ncbi:MAG: hypothetical protein FWD15_04600 [Alphaproteobacteria bacterium]|nr:hypothetical protein [Alphaproteobacteria bacterium]
MIKSHDKIFVITGLTCSGKTTQNDNFIADGLNVQNALRYMTRPIRPNEVNGRDAVFLSREEFKEQDALGKFLFTYSIDMPNGEYNDYLIGFRKEDIHGNVMVALNLVGAIPFVNRLNSQNVITVFLCPTFAEIKRRMRARGDEPNAADHKLWKNIQNSRYLRLVADSPYVMIGNGTIDDVYTQTKKFLTSQRRDIMKLAEMKMDVPFQLNKQH